MRHSPRALRRVSVLATIVLVGCSSRSSSHPPEQLAAESQPNAKSPTSAPTAVGSQFTLARLRKGFKTEIFYPTTSGPAPEPPADVFTLIRYDAPLGKNAAYVTPLHDGPKRPAIVWIAGGFDWNVDESAWTPAPRHNDQSASAFREAGLVLMLPSLRGSGDNPGKNECFLGEVDDILAAADFLAKRPDVDPQRIYLGGHSTGGTLALLAAASTDRFRAVFAFGPAEDPRGYDECIPLDAPLMEAKLRAPTWFVQEITTPTFIIEGEEGGNGPYDELQEARGSAPITVLMVPGANHFNVLRPGSELVARAILSDVSPTPSIKLTADAIARQIDAR